PFKDKHLDEARELCGDARTPFAFIDGEMTSWYGSRAIAGLDYLREFVPALNERTRPRRGDA
ncbi:MAG: cobalamin-binding protein, partial [Gammaproteobacteria bacterium]|nr:cobalamin-binding protein [Gammaproteobacteria bacterium]